MPPPNPDFLAFFQSPPPRAWKDDPSLMLWSRSYIRSARVLFYLVMLPAIIGWVIYAVLLLSDVAAGFESLGNAIVGMCCSLFGFGLLVLPFVLLSWHFERRNRHRIESLCNADTQKREVVHTTMYRSRNRGTGWTVWLNLEDGSSKPFISFNLPNALDDHEAPFALGDRVWASVDAHGNTFVMPKPHMHVYVVAAMRRAAPPS